MPRGYQRSWRLPCGLEAARNGNSSFYLPVLLGHGLEFGLAAVTVAIPPVLLGHGNSNSNGNGTL